MRIAFIIPSLANKGPIIMVQALVQHLVRKEGYHCDVYYFDALTDLQFDCKVKQISFFDSIEFQAYDLIHSHLFRPDLYCEFHHRKIRQSGAKVICTVHTAIYDDLTFTYGRYIGALLIPAWKFAWKKMDHVVVLTQAAKKYYQKTKFKSVSVIGNGIDIPLQPEGIPDADLQELLAFKKEYTLLGTVCSMDRRKGLEQILQLLTIKPDYAFVVIGDGMEREALMNMASHYKVSKRFKVFGFRSDGYRYIPHFDVYVLPSRSEGMPLALLEAMALKVPIVCSNIPALSLQFGEEVCSFFNLDDIYGLSYACELAVQDARIKTAVAFKLYNNELIGEKMGSNYHHLYQSIINMT